MTLWDAHMHSSFSGDAHTPPEEMADTAMEKHLPGITFTDHLDWDYLETPGLFDLNIEEYLQRIAQLQANFNTKDFHIHLGLELGLQPHLAGRHRKLGETSAADPELCPGVCEAGRSSRIQHMYDQPGGK